MLSPSFGHTMAWNRLKRGCGKVHHCPRCNNIGGDLTTSCVYTLEQLRSYYNGRGGRPGLIAIDKVVYNVTHAPMWGGGTYLGMKQGEDLTGYYKAHPEEFEHLMRHSFAVGRLRE